MKHQHISFIKSGIRILGYALLFVHEPLWPITVLIFSELIGVVEEVGHE
jgi:hypothetical protein